MEKKLVTDVQQIINNIADSKLRVELRRLHNTLFNGEPYEMLKDISINLGTTEKPKNVCLAAILGSGGFEKEIIENNTERYLNYESDNCRW